MVKWTGNEATFYKSTILDTPLAQGNIAFVFRDTNLDGVRGMMSEGTRPLLIEGGILSEVDFGNSHFSTITLRRVRQGEGGVRLTDITAEAITFEDVEMTKGTSLARSRIKTVTAHVGDFGTSFTKAIVDSIYFRDINLYYMAFSNVNLQKVNIANCKLYNTEFYDGYIDEFAVYNSTFDTIAGKNFNADIVMWDNVTLDGKVDLTNAQVNDFRPTRLKRGPQLKLITTGSNMRF